MAEMRVMTVSMKHTVDHIWMTYVRDDSTVAAWSFDGETWRGPVPAHPDKQRG